jgi:hypothetical protein
MKRPSPLVALLAVVVCAAANAKKAPELDASVCRQMATYHPEAGKEADYKPGVDVHGKPVVEADLNPSQLKVADTVSFDVTVDLAKYAGLAVPEGTESKTAIGTVTVDKDGRMTFNGKPLEGDAEKALRELCAPEPEAQQPETIDIIE